MPSTLMGMLSQIPQSAPTSRCSRSTVNRAAAHLGRRKRR